MSVTLTCGDGKTYANVVNAFAAIPSTITEEYIIEDYGTAGGTYSFTANILSAAINNTSGTYPIRIKGMTGNLESGGQVTYSFSGGATSGIALGTQYGVYFENLSVRSSVGRVIVANVFAIAIKCNLFTSAGPAITHRMAHFTCVLENTFATGDGITESRSLNNCVMKVVRDAIATGTIHQSIVYAGRFGPRAAAPITNSVLVGGTYGAVYLTVANSIIAPVSNSIFYSEANPTEISSGVLVADSYKIFPAQENLQVLDPILKKTGSILEWMTPTGLSKALPVNQTLIPNGIYASKNRTPVFIGAYTDYIAPDFPSAANVLTTDTVDGVQGTYNGASADDVRLNTPIGQTNGNLVLPVTNDVVLGVEYGANGTEYTGTRNLAADYPVEPDVFLGVEYDYGNKVGTFNPYASGIQTGNLVLPTEAEVLALVGYGSNGTEFEGTLTSPDAPVLLSVVAGNTQFTATVTTSLPTDVARIIYKKNTGTSWILSSESAVGGGTITVTGLDNGNKYDVLSVVVNDGIYSPISNSLTVIPLSPAGYSRDIVRYRVIKTSDNEGGWTDTISDPVIIYPTLIYDDVNVTATLKREDDIIVEDVIQIYDLEFYRVTAIRIAVNGLHKSLSLEKIERPIWSQVR